MSKMVQIFTTHTVVFTQMLQCDNILIITFSLDAPEDIKTAENSLPQINSIQHIKVEASIWSSLGLNREIIQNHQTFSQQWFYLSSAIFYHCSSRKVKNSIRTYRALYSIMCVQYVNACLLAWMHISVCVHAYVLCSSGAVSHKQQLTVTENQ